MNTETLCIAAILKEEDPFVDEWIAYHRLVGVDHFYLYDNDPRQPLGSLTRHHAEYVTVIDWQVEHVLPAIRGNTTQARAYSHFVDHYAARHEWVAMIDADEFIVVREAPDLRAFLAEFAPFHAVSLNWHVFGHNGLFENPRRVLPELTRRMAQPSPRVKTISRTSAIASVDYAHYPKLREGAVWVDANKRPFSDVLYPGRADAAHINHYQCRSFEHWMSRPRRGDSGSGPDDPRQAWRFAEQACLKQFVTTVAKDKNELVDTYMLAYVPLVEQYLEERRR